jgi:uncharacterized protein YciI
MSGASSRPLWLGTLSLRPGLADLTRWTDVERGAVQAHFEALQAHEREGRLVIAGRSQDMDGADRLAEDTIGIVIFHAADRDEAESIMQADPAVRADVMRYQLRSFGIAVARGGLAGEAD